MVLQVWTSAKSFHYDLSLKDEIDNMQDDYTYTPVQTTCVGEYCNPNWTPFGNMVQGLQGYNVLLGNPLQNTGDPGFTHQIFVPTKIKDCGRVTLEDGITANDVTGCKQKLSAQSFSTMESYRLVRDGSRG